MSRNKDLVTEIVFYFGKKKKKLKRQVEKFKVQIERDFEKIFVKREKKRIILYILCHHL